MVALYWLLAAAVFLGLEIITMGLTTIWFAGGALIAAIAAMIQFPIIVQIFIFAVVSLLLLIVTRPFASRFLNNRTVKTNVESLVGQKCLVTKPIDNLRATGEVVIRGQTWSAKSLESDCVIPENAIVEVKSITGVKLVVSVISLPEKIILL